MKVDITKAQIIAIIEMADTMSATDGVGDADENNEYNKEVRKCVRLIDRFLKKNGYKRNFR